MSDTKRALLAQCDSLEQVRGDNVESDASSAFSESDSAEDEEAEVDYDSDHAMNRCDVALQSCIAQ